MKTKEYLISQPFLHRVYYFIMHNVFTSVLMNLFSNMLQAPLDNGSPITLYRLEWNKGEKGGSYTEVYCGPHRQFKHSHKLPPATPCSFRLQAVNSIGARCVTSFKLGLPEPWSHTVSKFALLILLLN